MKISDARARLHRLLAEDARPVRLGAAVAVGVLFGCTPFYGFQTLLALAVAWPLRLNKVAVVLGTQVSLPPLIPLVVFGGANLGERILEGRWLPLSLAEIRAAPAAQLAKEFFAAWLLGGVVLGVGLGAIAWVVTTIVARRVQRTAVGR